MKKQEKDSNDILFVTRHYRYGAFDADSAWKRLGLAGRSWWNRARIAAAVCGLVILGATATVFVTQRVLVPAETSAPTPQQDILEVSRTIDFENAPLPDVIAAIEKKYGVKVTGIPADARQMHLSLHYEGNATDLITTINEILGTSMAVTAPAK